LNARQCHETFGLRAKNEPLTTDTTLRQTAPTVKHEEMRYDNARKTGKTTKRTTDNNAGRPEPHETRDRCEARKQRTQCNYKGMLLCRLTLELSGGEAVRLERDVRPRNGQAR
jgi:hypothetical protein